MYYKFITFVVLPALFIVYIDSTGIGSTCFLASDCGLWHFVCENNICKCDDGHIPDRDNKECAVDFNMPCGYHDKCFDKNADCVDVAWPKMGECKCNKGYTLDHKQMICQVVIGNNCTTSDECIEGTCKLADSGRDDKNNQTQCFCTGVLEPNINGTKCLPRLGDECSAYGECARENSICRYNTVAQKRICECADNYKEAERNGTTFCLAMLGNTCKNATTDCADVGTSCLPKNETENCPKSLKESYKKNYCTVKDTYWPEEPIPEPTKYCVCDKYHVRHPTISTCLKVATHLNDTCTDDIQCTTYSGFGSLCQKGFCQCKSGFYFDVDFDRCVRSCLCTKDSKLQEIVDVFQDLKPALEVLGRDSNIDVTMLIKKINDLVD